MSRRINDLASYFRPVAMELLARAVEKGIMLAIIDTLRTPEEQEANLAKGVSLTLKSKHLPQPPEGKSEAIDVCPYDTYLIHGPDKLKWDKHDPAWKVLGEIGEKLGLRWGGRWHDPKTGEDMWDPGHFEWQKEKV